MNPVALLALLLGLAAPARPAALPLGVPPSWADRVVYCRTFQAPAAEVNAPGLEESAVPPGVPDGVRGAAALASAGPLRLSGPALSPHRPLTVLLWWKLRSDAGPGTGLTVAHLAGPRGFLSAFYRSGPWCGLEKPAAVLQAYYLPGIRSVNQIYDREPLERGDLKAGVWHHSALMVTGGAVVGVWLDGRRVAEIRLVGRELAPEDALHTLDVGGGPGMVIDEVMVLNRPLTAAEIAEYVTATRQMREAGWPVRE